MKKILPPYPNQLEKYRKQRGYSMEDAACILGVTSKTIQHWENGASMPNSNNFIMLCALYRDNGEGIYGDYMDLLEKELHQLK